MILAGDLGGTKTLLAWFDAHADRAPPQHCHHYASGEYDAFLQILDDFLARYPVEKIDAICLGVAGPVLGDACMTTNLPWHVQAHDIATRCGVARVKLLNDLEAAAWGLEAIPDGQWVRLQAHAAPGIGHRAVAAAGTGLGMAILCWDGARHHIMATEGGHSDFAPQDEEQDALLRFLRARHGAHVSYERLVSGSGLVAIYEFLLERTGTTVPLAFTTAEDPAAWIGQAALVGDDLAARAARLMIRIYGAATGNLALSCLPFGGVYLTGGIAPKLLPLFQEGIFVEGFTAKGRYRELLSRIPIKLCLESSIALHGAACHARHVLLRV